MCWAVPAQIIEIDGEVGRVELSGTVREVGLQLLEAPQVGDWVLIHAGFAIQKVDKEEAEETLRLLEEISQEMRP
ncbi:MAG: HypC/HybG/HupF family hydrogenase formation chaperone [Candidatus Brocadiia bacterium]